MANAVIDHAQAHLTPQALNAYMTMVDFFGPPKVKAPLSLYGTTDIFSLAELWEGQNQVLSEAVDESLSKTGSWINGLFPRVEYKGGLEGTLYRYVFESEVLGEAIEQHPFELLEARKEKEDFALVFHGTSFRMNTDFIFAPDGFQVLARHCAQMQRCALDTEAIDVLDSIMHHGTIQHLTGYQLPMPLDQFLAAMSQRTGWFAAYQKGANGAARIEARAKQMLISQHVDANVAIMPPTTLRYVYYVDQHIANYDKAGEKTYSKELDFDRKKALSTYNTEVQRFEARSFKMPKGLPPRNPFVQPRTIGEWYHLFDRTSCIPNNEYVTKHRNWILGDSQKTFATITLERCLRECGVWKVDKNTPENRKVALTDCGAKVLRAVALDFSQDGTALVGQKRRCPPGGSVPSVEKIFEAAGELESLKTQIEHAIVKNNEHKLWDAFKLRWQEWTTGSAPSTSSASRPSKEAKIARRQPATQTEFTSGTQPSSTAVGALQATTGGRSPQQQSSSALAGAQVLDLQNVLDAPFSLGAALTLMQFNIRLPVNFLIFRPYIRLYAGSFVLLRGGKDTATIKSQHAMVDLVRNGNSRTLGFNFSFSSKCVIHARENLCLFPDVFVSGVIGGLGTRAFIRDQTDETTLRTLGADMFIFMVPYKWQPETDALDITGYWSPNTVSQVLTKPEPLFPTATAYADMWGARAPCNPISYEQMIEQRPHSNTFCLRGWHKSCIPKRYCDDEHSNVVRGRGHLGPVWTPKTMRVLNGEDEVMDT